MRLMEFVENLTTDIQNLKLRVEEITLVKAPNGDEVPTYDKLYTKKKLRDAISSLADASMIICGMYPDNDTSFDEEEL